MVPLKKVGTLARQNLVLGQINLIVCCEISVVGMYLWPKG